MALISCPECEKSISDKAKLCPHCGFPMRTISSDIKDGISSTVDVASTSARNIKKSITTPFMSPERLSLEEIKDLIDLNLIPSSCFRLNGIGTTFSGCTQVSGYPGLGLIRKYFTIFFIPVIPLGTYLVQDWNGRKGKFVGKVRRGKAKYLVNQKAQTLFVALESFMYIACIVLVILAVGGLFRLLR